MAILDHGTVREAPRELPVFTQVQVCVIGGGSAGYPSAIAARATRAERESFIAGLSFF